MATDERLLRSRSSEYESDAGACRKEWDPTWKTPKELTYPQVLNTTRCPMKAWIHACKPPSGGGPGSTEIRDIVRLKTFINPPLASDGSDFSCMASISGFSQPALDGTASVH